MTSGRQQRIFEELGLLAEQETPNPYKMLGIDPEFARGLLREDSRGAALQFVVASMHRALSRRYHPDLPGTGDADRFSAIHTAHDRIASASPEALLRWAKTEGSSGSSKETRLQEQRELVAQRAAGLVRANIELGHHPQHFSQMAWSQGVLAQRGDSTLLLRQYEHGGLQVLRGNTLGFSKSKSRRPLDARLRTYAFDFQQFLAYNNSFGLEPDTKIAAYIDEDGRASILSADLGFIMDVTDPVTAYHSQRRFEAKFGADEENTSRYWMRSLDPVLLTTAIPGPATSAGSSDGQIITFPARTSGKHGSKSLAWSLQMEVAGTYTDNGAYRRVRHSRDIGAAALSGGQQKAGYFGMAAMPARQIIEHDIGYSPLVASGNSLLLYDAQNQMPVVTDIRVVGMIGNGAQG